ncbi:hypothetical protein JG687_00018148 [Phytophthora cactorum]|uniref:Necrosis inducing protein n=2 Tax=Phytophthora TaxID=4783 RepID=A0A329REC5_9STRA|nr:hypothetical protein Pcac1_g14631 [Phytophthora cactorum]KAG2798096.1 hypothetical protein PC111_g21000 [Phytophthora cactorum]KAG2798145.1 hypothetical protein PC112_g21485 [Phytophthora cactorum]KAG2828557.1 hypothetical protein PC113_g21448 [Phytophthora cactorum]KAG2877248.1 hypothetical protein PC114_g23758 [Phytophthora cactorum]
MSSRIVVVVVFALMLSNYCANAQNDGELIFWGDKNFKGEKWHFHRTLEPQFCYNDNVGKPSSITWKNQLKHGKFRGNRAKIAFYTAHDCKGFRRAWFTTEKDFPRNLALDRIDNKIKSFMLWQNSDHISVIVRDARARMLRTGEYSVHRLTTLGYLIYHSSSN